MRNTLKFRLIINKDTFVSDVYTLKYTKKLNRELIYTKYLYIEIYNVLYIYCILYIEMYNIYTQRLSIILYSDIAQKLI